MRPLCALIRRIRRWELNDDAVFAIVTFAGFAVALIATFLGLPE